MRCTQQRQGSSRAGDGGLTRCVFVRAALRSRVEGGGRGAITALTVLAAGVVCMCVCVVLYGDTVR